MKIFAAIVAFLTILAIQAHAKPPELDAQVVSTLRALEADGDLIRASTIRGKLPKNPEDSAWSKAEEFKIALVPQIAIAPRSYNSKRSELSVRALHNKKEIAFLLVWSDATKNETATSPEQFRDAIALGFPMPSADNALPYIGMGHKGKPVNIWHWKASWQADLEGFRGVDSANPGRVPNNHVQDFRTGEMAGSPMSQHKRESSVENILAEGFGTVTSVPAKGLTGEGTWKDGLWKVVVRRARKANPQESGADATNGFIPIAFSIWDGAARERNGMKGISRWKFLQIEGEAIAPEAVAGLMPGPVPGGDAARGKDIASKFRCYSCHVLPGDPPQQFPGPDLTLAGGMHRTQYLIESIAKPNAIVVPAPGYYDPGTGLSTMPSYEEVLQEEQLKDMAEYLRSLQ